MHFQKLTPLYYTQKQVMLLSSLSRSTLERLLRANKMPAPKRFGSCRRFLIQEVHEWLEGNWPKEGE